MDDKEIIELYFDRNEDAISQIKDKYGKACYKIAYNILFNNEDSEECVNDTYLGAWNSIPPHKPDLLSAFLFNLTRRLSISRLRMNLAKKRYDGRTIKLISKFSLIITNCNSEHNLTTDFINTIYAISKQINKYAMLFHFEQYSVFLYLKVIYGKKNKGFSIPIFGKC